MSSESDFMTAQTMVVDGGAVMNQAAVTAQSL
jgi:hypothetical protein